METQPTRDWDDAYANMAHIPGSADLPEFWAKRAADYRASGRRIETDILYGDHKRERFDLVWPEGTPKGLAVFVHGGYWMKLDKSFWTDLAEGARASGWAVCLPSYVLAPEARIAQMTQQIGRAITKAASHVDGPIRLAGHSAGGHLVSRMVCADTPLPEAVASRIAHTLSISGLHDLRPLIWTEMNDTLGLDEAEAQAESPVLHRPLPQTRITAWVGGAERPEFIRQAQILDQVWSGLKAEAACVIDGDHNHFTVIEGLSDPKSPITQAFIGTAEDAP